MKAIHGIILAAICMLFPVAASAEISIADMAADEGAFALDASLDMDAALDADDIARPGRPGPGPRPGYGPRHPGPRPGYRPHPVPLRPAPRPYYAPVVVRPHVVAPVVVVDQPSTVVVDDSPVVSAREGAVFGFGVRGVVATNSPMSDVNNDVSGGFGFYLKFRPVRYFSIELQNDYIFGSLEDCAIGSSQDYVKVPFSAGLRFHFLDYGPIDLYAAAAASISVWAYSEGYDPFWDETMYMDDIGLQFGGQAGLGISFIAGIFELGLDARYTIETVPDFIPSGFRTSFSRSDYNSRSSFTHSVDDEAVHGFLLSLSLGFAI